MNDEMCAVPKMFMLKITSVTPRCCFKCLQANICDCLQKKPRYNSNRFPVREISVQQQQQQQQQQKATDRRCTGEQWCHEFGECKSNLHRRLLWNAAWELTKSLWPPFCHILCCENTVTLYNARVAEKCTHRWWKWKHTDTHTHHV